MEFFFVFFMVLGTYLAGYYRGCKHMEPTIRFLEKHNLQLRKLLELQGKEVEDE